ncbi:hypothetical protein ABIA31_006456 [Catenulispora sp. MAP5-51]|uniref:hypothetical protein n=1 Tax=Catenulispora sp. MAP5-51 TaxID=3156298 RepID=UPI003519CB87
MEDTQRIETQLFQRVCDVLDRAGFRMRDGGMGLTITSTPQGVHVSWRPAHAPVHPAAGLRAALVTAVTSVLEQAGYLVYAEEEDLLITVPRDDKTRIPSRT